MARIDLRINVSFKNNPHEEDLYKFVKDKGNIMGESAFIKMLIEKAFVEENRNKKE